MASVMGKKTDIEDTRTLVGENILDVMEYRCRHHYGKDVGNNYVHDYNSFICNLDIGMKIFIII